MKLFALPDGAVDRLDRAQWFTCPFDLTWAAAAVPVAVRNLSLQARSVVLTLETRATLTLQTRSVTLTLEDV
ncbi:MAG TPA: hypothetical protein DCP69_04280 [Candidatus Omnitrophica bacterium]|nr:hypothetical protein [Candidatus Omnitrophota bacterium]